jgi:rhodanese-related sulfurtransferase
MNKISMFVVVVVLLVFFLLRQLGNAKPEEAQALLKKGGRVIDVRTPEEFRSGHLAAAVNIPLGELQQRIAREVPDKATPVLLYCASGARSAAGKRIVAGLGYPTVLNLGSYHRAAGIVQP